jgi:hypothetical protein
MKTQMTPSNGMSSLNTDAMTASQRLRPKLTPSAGTLCVSNELLTERIALESYQCQQARPQF